MPERARSLLSAVLQSETAWRRAGVVLGALLVMLAFLLASRLTGEGVRRSSPARSTPPESEWLDAEPRRGDAGTTKSGETSRHDRREPGPDERVTATELARRPDAGVPVSPGPTSPLTTPSDEGAPRRLDRSPSAEAETALLTIENSCSEALDLVWLDTEGHERPYGVIARGAITSQPTFVAHVWVLRTAETRRVLRTFAAEGESYVDACPEGDVLRDPHPPQLAPGAPHVCSQRVDDTMTLTVTNACRVPLRLEWVDFSCALRPYATIAPGQSYVQETFAAHVWRAIGPDGTVHAEHVAALDRASMIVECAR
jgi:hypothetical protein